MEWLLLIVLMIVCGGPFTTFVVLFWSLITLIGLVILSPILIIIAVLIVILSGALWNS